jgi:hypothetical protein
LLDLAAEAGKLDRTALSVQGGKVVGPQGAAFEFGQLTKGKKLMREVRADAAVTPVAKWSVEPAPAGAAAGVAVGAAAATPGRSRPG